EDAGRGLGSGHGRLGQVGWLQGGGGAMAARGARQACAQEVPGNPFPRRGLRAESMAAARRASSAVASRRATISPRLLMTIVYGARLKPKRLATRTSGSRAV